MARPKSDSNKQLTDVELQIMNILWRLSEASVHQVLDELTKVASKDYAYTTVSTLLRVLEKKQVVGSKKQGRGHLYFPVVERSRYQSVATDHLVKNVFSGQKQALVLNLLGRGEISAQELKEIKQFIESQEQK